MFWRILGYGPPNPAYPDASERSESVREAPERRRATGAGGSARPGPSATGPRSERPRIAAAVRLTPQAIRRIAHRYRQGGLDRALYERERPGGAALLEESQRQRVIAMVCSEPPEGRARWTVRLVAEEAVKRKLVPRVGRETIRILLLHHDLKPWREKNVVRGRTQ